jgi:hypothetical protein
MDNWRPGGTSWMDLDLVGQPSGALVSFVPPMSIKDRSCMDPGQVTDLLSRAYNCLWGREDLFLSCHGFRLFSDRLFRVVISIGLRRSKHHTEALSVVFGGLEYELGRGPRPLDRSRTGWSCLCLGYEQGVFFLRHPAGHMDSRIAVSV